MTSRKLPVIRDCQEHPAGRMMKIEKLDLEFSNGEQRCYTRMQTHGLGAVISEILDED